MKIEQFSKGFLVVKCINFETKYVGVLTYEVSSFYNNCYMFYIEGEGSDSTKPLQSQPLKSPPRLGLKN